MIIETYSVLIGEKLQLSTFNKDDAYRIYEQLKKLNPKKEVKVIREIVLCDVIKHSCHENECTKFLL